MPEKIKMGWDDFDESVDKIVEHYKNEGLTKIVGISRGGLPLAVKLSNKLGIPMVPVVWQTRDGEVKQTGILNDLREEGVSTVLFVDDICDSGETIEQITKIVPYSRWCTLITKLDNVVEYSPLSFVDDERWIIFPWE